MEEECLKIFSSSNTALVAKGKCPRGNKNWGRPYKKAPHRHQKSRPKSSVAKKQKAKGNGEKNIARVKCYNYGKKNHFTRDCSKPSKVPFFTHTPKVYVCSHTLVVNSFPSWILDARSSNQIVRDRDGFVDFHCYLVDSQTVVLRNGSEEDVLGVDTYKLILRRGNTLLDDVIYTPRVRVCLLSLVALMKL